MTREVDAGGPTSICLGWRRTRRTITWWSADDRSRDPRQAQELLGYAVHDSIPRGGGYLGMVRMQDPVELLSRHEL